MNDYYKQQQQQFTDFLDELEQLFLKHNINSVSTYNDCLIMRRPHDEDWLFDFWTDTDSFVWPSVRKYKPAETKSDMNTQLASDLDEIMNEPTSAPLIPLSDQPKTPEVENSIEFNYIFHSYLYTFIDKIESI